MAVLGASADPPGKNVDFANQLGLRYPLLSDPDGTAIAALGIQSGRGRAKRTTFLIDQQGVIRRIWQDVKVANHVEAVLEATEHLLTREP